MVTCRSGSEKSSRHRIPTLRYSGRSGTTLLHSNVPAGFSIWTSILSDTGKSIDLYMSHVNISCEKELFLLRPCYGYRGTTLLHCNVPSVFPIWISFLSDFFDICHINKSCEKELF